MLGRHDSLQIATESHERSHRRGLKWRKEHEATCFIAEVAKIQQQHTHAVQLVGRNEEVSLTTDTRRPRNIGISWSIFM